MGELSQTEVIERGDDYFEIADAIHPFGGCTAARGSGCLREAARHLLQANQVGYRDMAGKIEQCRRCFGIWAKASSAGCGLMLAERSGC
jgi:hypothetical protein